MPSIYAPFRFALPLLLGLLATTAHAACGTAQNAIGYVSPQNRSAVDALINGFESNVAQMGAARMRQDVDAQLAEVNRALRDAERMISAGQLSRDNPNYRGLQEMRNVLQKFGGYVDCRKNESNNAGSAKGKDKSAQAPEYEDDSPPAPGNSRAVNPWADNSNPYDKVFANAGNKAKTAGKAGSQTEGDGSSPTPPPVLDDYTGQPCRYFTRPAMEEGRINYYSNGALVCFQGKAWLCKNKQWVSKGNNCDAWGKGKLYDAESHEQR